MSHEHGKQKPERYSEDAHLTGLANEILKIYDGSELLDASTFQKRIIFTSSSSKNRNRFSLQLEKRAQKSKAI